MTSDERAELAELEMWAELMPTNINPAGWRRLGELRFRDAELDALT